MVIEIVITVVLVLLVAHILYHKIKKNISGKCCCNKCGKSVKKCNK